MIDGATAAFVKEVGVPVFAFIMMYVLYVQNQKWVQKSQEKSEERYVNLVNCFIESVKTISSQQTAALEKLSSKMEDHTRSKEEFMEFIKEERRNHG